MSDWLAPLVRRLERGEDVVRVVVSTVRGSTPREPGACMLVGPFDSDGTIGGGHLEWKSLEIARGMIASDSGPRYDRFVLGAALGQCCGGIVELWFERVSRAEIVFFREALARRRAGTPLAIATTWTRDTPVSREILDTTADAPRARLTRYRKDVLVERVDLDRLPLWLFGAGHVGHALVRTLAELPFEVTWIDGREGVFPSSCPENTMRILSEEPVDEVWNAPPGAVFLVLTHRHDLDFDLCRAILSRGNFLWAGVIGSDTKAASFRGRLLRAGIPPEQIGRLVSPIGIEGISSKEPAAIAVSVAAQLLQIEASAASACVPKAAAL